MVTTFLNDQRRPGVLRPPAHNARPTGSHRKPNQRRSHVVDDRPFDRVGEILRRERAQLASDAERALLGANYGWRSNGPAMRLGSIMTGAVLACAGTIGAGIAFGIGGTAAVSPTAPERPALSTQTQTQTQTSAPADVSPRPVPPIVTTTPAQAVDPRPAPRPAPEGAAAREPGKPTTRARVEPATARPGRRPTPLASPALVPHRPADPSPSSPAPTTPHTTAPAEPPTVTVGPPVQPPGVAPVEDPDPAPTPPLHGEPIGTGTDTLPTPPPGYPDAAPNSDADLDLGAVPAGAARDRHAVHAS